MHRSAKCKSLGPAMESPAKEGPVTRESIHEGPARKGVHPRGFSLRGPPNLSLTHNPSIDAHIRILLVEAHRRTLSVEAHIKNLLMEAHRRKFMNGLEFKIMKSTLIQTTRTKLSSQPLRIFFRRAPFGSQNLTAWEMLLCGAALAPCASCASSL